MEENRSIIKNIELVQRFRDILYYQRQISNSSFALILFLRFILFYVMISIGIDPITIIKIIIGVFALAAILFTPYIFYVLTKEKKFGWIILFFVMIIIPELLGYLIFKDTLAFEAALLIPLAFFYFYCYLIKYEVDKWISQYNWYQERLQQKKEYEERKKNEMIL
ncbi:MAG: hypothetical protein RBR74_03385 [Ignavibacteriaceae bacterium]|nr:hypothetical protein [Ignavibacteriaceae bacterium]